MAFCPTIHPDCRIVFIPKYFQACGYGMYVEQNGNNVQIEDGKKFEIGVQLGNTDRWFAIKILINGQQPFDSRCSRYTSFGKGNPKKLSGLHTLYFRKDDGVFGLSVVDVFVYWLDCDGSFNGKISDEPFHVERFYLTDKTTPHAPEPEDV